MMPIARNPDRQGVTSLAARPPANSWRVPRPASGALGGTNEKQQALSQFLEFHFRQGGLAMAVKAGTPFPRAFGKILALPCARAGEERVRSLWDSIELSSVHACGGLRNAGQRLRN